MKDKAWVLFERIQELVRRKEGQDLVEYSLVMAMIALGTVVAMQSLDLAIMQSFNKVSSVLAAALHG
jgi:Flp pilus assembly pilin Flp